MAQKLTISEIISNTVKPILSDDTLKVHFYQAQHLPKKWVELDKEYADRIAKTNKERARLVKEYESVLARIKKIETNFVETGDREDTSKLDEELSTLESKIKELNKAQYDNPYYELAPLCKMEFEPFKQLILDAADGDEELARNVIADKIYEEYLLALKLAQDEEKKRREATGTQAILEGIQGK